jgi:hypothetical protein
VRNASAGAKKKKASTCFREGPGLESQPNQFFFFYSYRNICILSLLSHPLLVIFDNSESLTKSSQAPNKWRGACRGREGGDARRPRERPSCSFEAHSTGSPAPTGKQGNTNGLALNALQGCPAGLACRCVVWRGCLVHCSQDRTVRLEPDRSHVDN